MAEEIKISLTEICRQSRYNTVIQIVRHTIETGVIENNIFYQTALQNGTEIRRKVVFELDIDQKQYATEEVFNKNQSLEIYKWFRVSGINNHFVFTSNDTLESLLRRDKKYLIIVTPGSSFFSKPASYDLRSLIDKHEEPNEIKFHLANSIDYKKIKHEEANWWGLFKLYHFHKILTNTTIQSIEKTEKELSNRLEYNLLKYIYSEELLPNDFSDKQKILNRLTEISNLNFNIVFIDDHANNGWGDLLKNILQGNTASNKGNFIIICPNEHSTVDKLLKEYVTKTSGKKINLVISDLRYNKKEEELRDYRNLISFQLITKINDDTRTNILYLTAANNLFMYKKLIDKKHLPLKLFIKEGFDFNLTNQESLNNYKELTQTIYDILIAKQKAKGIIEAMDIEETKRIELIKDNLTAICLNNYSTSTFSSYTHIVLDTNFFISKTNHNSVLKCFKALKEKIFIHEAVLKELQWNAKGDEMLKKVLCELYANLIVRDNYNVDKWNSTGNTTIKIIEKDMADKYLVDYVKYLLSDKGNKVLFVSDDRSKGVYGGKKLYSKGPYRELSDLIKADRTIINLSVSLVQEFIDSVKL